MVATSHQEILHDRTLPRPMNSAVVLVLLQLAFFWGPATAQEPEGLPTSEAQAFMGYWMLTADFGGRELKMGLEVGELATFTTSRLVAFFGELDGEKLRRDGESLVFDVTSDFGPFLVKLDIEGQGLVGSLHSGDQVAAQFTGVQSDRVALQRFMIPDNETRLERGDQLVRLRFVSPRAEGADFERLASLTAGGEVKFSEFEAIKLTTELPLKVQGLEVPIENVTKDYPGVYSLWIKKTDEGWGLAFNNKPDVWGTQYDSSADIGTVPLKYEKSEEPSEVLTASLADAESGTTLTLTWGEHRWTTPLEVVAQP